MFRIAVVAHCPEACSLTLSYHSWPFRPGAYRPGFSSSSAPAGLQIDKLSWPKKQQIRSKANRCRFYICQSIAKSGEGFWKLLRWCFYKSSPAKCVFLVSCCRGDASTSILQPSFVLVCPYRYKVHERPALAGAFARQLWLALYSCTMYL